MKITFLGHAGLFIETRSGRILCDPWFNPAYFASWFPFPANDTLDLSSVGTADYLYISHGHHDHLDEQFLAEHVPKDVIVLLPEFPVADLEGALRGLGFGRFIRARARRPVEIEPGLRCVVVPLSSPADGPIGDSCLIVDDGRTRILNQNDARPPDLEDLASLGPYDGHFLQFSGANWYPMVYDLPAAEKDRVARQKRNNSFFRAERYIESLSAKHVFPFAGPPCFLDDDLFWLNDFDHSETNIFPDQKAFLEYLGGKGIEKAHLSIPGTVVELDGGHATVVHPLARGVVDAIFEQKRAYLVDYKSRWESRLRSERASWAVGRVDVVQELKAWFEPLLKEADQICRGMDDRILLRAGPVDVVIDFRSRAVEPWTGEYCPYRFHFPLALVETCIVRRHADWVNELFLSCRFRAERDGLYNEHLYSFFKSLNPERMRYVDGYYAERAGAGEMIRMGGYLVQRYCPHLKADLTRFGAVADGILTCRLHGWRFDLTTSECLTAGHCRIKAVPACDEVGQGNKDEYGPDRLRPGQPDGPA